jgi:hypothetical protein
MLEMDLILKKPLELTNYEGMTFLHGTVMSR